MRLIDADDLLAKVQENVPGFMDSGSTITKAFIMAMINTKSVAPTIDAVPVVRCENCQWWHESETNDGYGDCGQANGITLKPHDWYCADGKQREYVKPTTESATDWDGVKCE